jgi:hypothetical protein
VPVLLSLAWLAALAAFGVAALYRVAPFLSRLERVAYGIVLGLVVGTLALLPLATLAGGLSPAIVVGVGVVSASLAAALWFGPGGPGLTSARTMDDLRQRWWAWVVGLDPWGTVLIGVLSARWVFLWSGAIQRLEDGLWAGHEYLWSDWPTHIGIVTRFAWGENFPPQNTLYAGLPLSYHHLSDLTPAGMVVLGMDPVDALPLHSFLLSIVAALAIWAFIRRLALAPSIATLGTLLFIMGAGLGWFATLGTLQEYGDLARVLVDKPWDEQAVRELNIRFYNPYLAFLMSQRAYLYGLPLAMLMLTTLVSAVRRRDLGRFALAGVVGGLLPLAHLPTLLAMAMTTPFLVLLLTPRFWRDPLHRIPWAGWILFHAVWIAVAMPQLLVQLGGGAGALASFRIQLGWVADPDPWWWFWIKNAGLFIPIAVIGLLGRRVLPPSSRGVVLALMPIFVIANVAVFQPWDWDNHKILVYWFLGAAIVAAAAVVHGWRSSRRAVVRFVLAAAVLTMILSASLENLDQFEGHMRYRMITSEQIRVAELVREVSEPDAVIVTGMQSHDPVMMLSGRQVLMGYWGQLWVSGIPYEERQAEVVEILQLGPRADQLIARHGVDFVVIGPQERADQQADEPGFAARFPVAAATDQWRIYDVRSVSGSG